MLFLLIIKIILFANFFKRALLTPKFATVCHRHSAAGDSRGKKEARRCEPGSLRFNLTVLFSLDPLSSELSFSFE